MLLTDWQTIDQRDPATRDWMAILSCYPGQQALLFHRLAHWLYNIGIPVLPRFISHLSRFLTGIEIHPGAKIGKEVLIAHCRGVVIGETAIIGDYTVIAQDVTLGGTGKENGKRHPTLGNHVVVGAGAKVLGNIQIGERVHIEAGAVVLRDVPSNSTVVGIPGRIIRRDSLSADILAHDSQRDLEAEVIRTLFERVKVLEKQIEQLQTQSYVSSNQVDHRASDNTIEEFLNGAGI